MTYSHARFVFVLLLAASLCPALLVSIPAMVDYPNHLARMYLLSEIGAPDANPFYQTAWALYPNLAMDLIIPAMARFVSVETAARIFLLLSQVLIVTGSLAIERSVKGRMQISGFVALMFLYCLPFTFGFLNFEFGLGASLWGIAVMLMLNERPWPLRLAVNTVIVAALFTAHFFALGIYGATLGLIELQRAWDGKTAYRDTAWRLVVLAIPALILLAIMKFTGGGIGGDESVWHLDFKPLWLFIILNAYNMPVSAATVCLLVGFMYFAFKHGVLTVERAGLWLAAGFAFLYVAIPSRLFGTAFVDLRMIAAAAFIVPAFITLTAPTVRWRWAAIACAVGVTLPNLAVIYFVWLSYRADYAAMIASFQHLGRGALVLIGGSDAGDDPPLHDLASYPIYHSPTLGVHYAKAFVPDLFTMAGKQPIRPRPEYERINTPESGPVPVGILVALANGKTADVVPSYISTWPRDFDFLYLLGPRIANPLPNILQEVDSSRRFVLYKIKWTP
ncbi:MAG: hypothetical protein WDN48_07820 [Pseudolabrys sp.]